MIDIEEEKLTRFCFSCHERGMILVRLIHNGKSTKKTKNFISACTNPECFRYTKNEENPYWEKVNGEIADDRDRDRLYRKRKRDEQLRQSNLKAQNDRKAILVAQSEKVRGVETKGDGESPRPNEGSPGEILDHKEHSVAGQAPRDG